MYRSALQDAGIKPMALFWSESRAVFSGHATVTASEMPQTVVLKKTDCDSRKSDKSSSFPKQEIRWTWVPTPRPRAQIQLHVFVLVCAVFLCGSEYFNLF